MTWELWAVVGAVLFLAGAAVGAVLRSRPRRDEDDLDCGSSGW